MNKPSRVSPSGKEPSPKPFDDADIGELARRLGWDCTKTRQVTQHIETAILEVQRRHRMGPGYVKKELAALRSFAAELDRAARAVRRILQPNSVSSQVEELARMGGLSRDSLIAIHHVLDGLGKATRFLGEEPSLYRARSSLPVEKEIKNKAFPETQVLWPVLFDTWEQAYGQPRSATKALVEFIDFVHEHAGLPSPVSENTVKSAVKRWRRMRRARLQAQLLVGLRDIYVPRSGE